MSVSLNPNYLMLLCTITICNTSKYKYDVTRATQALARVRVALAHGLECHVASTWARVKNSPFCHLFNVLIQLKIKNKSK